jgi:hypothetical protein
MSSSPFAPNNVNRNITNGAIERPTPNTRFDTELGQHPQIWAVMTGPLCDYGVDSAMWTFVRNECVEPTNNDAERAIRRAVIWRKTSLGTQSQRGSLYAERILTCAATLRLQGRSVFEFLHQVCSAVLQCSAPVSLFP